MAVPHLTVSVDERTRLANKRVGELVLGKWRLQRLIGMGGMAAVFEAAHDNGSLVAIKILHQDLAGVDEIRERFLSEGYAANRVAHPGVVPVRDEGTTADGAVFLVMDLLRGQTLAERLEDEAAPLSVSAVLEIASQLLDVLVTAHGRGIVHRDIKPENVFLTEEGRVRLLDFGIACVDGSAGSRASRPGTTLGTPAFMPPEQALGMWTELDGRSDLWSVGATMYLLLSGTPVREPGGATEQLLLAMTRPVPSLGSMTTLPRSLVAVVDRALAFDREDRFPDARSMQLAVRAASEELSAADSRASSVPPSLAPVAVPLRTPWPVGRERLGLLALHASAPDTPVVDAAAPPAPRGALPWFIGLGFAVGFSIVIAARFSVRAPLPAAPLPANQPTTADAAVPAPSAPLASANAPVVSPPSASARKPLVPAPLVATPRTSLSR